MVREARSDSSLVLTYRWQTARDMPRALAWAVSSKPTDRCVRIPSFDLLASSLMFVPLTGCMRSRLPPVVCLLSQTRLVPNSPVPVPPMKDPPSTTKFAPVFAVHQLAACGVSGVPAIANVEQVVPTWHGGSRITLCFHCDESTERELSEPTRIMHETGWCVASQLRTCLVLRMGTLGHSTYSTNIACD